MGVHKVIGVPMEDALSPEQCNRMSLFLQLLSNVSRKGKVDIGGFIKEYRFHVNGHQTRNSNTWPVARVETAVSLRKSGKSWLEVASALGCTEYAARNAIVRRYGRLRV